MVRNDVWPVKVRKIASAIDSKCVDCKIKRKKFAGQVMGDLPSFRTEMLPPFAVTGMDLLGPQEVKDDIIRRGPKQTKKVWIVIFTCLSTRAVQLDIAQTSLQGVFCTVSGDSWQYEEVCKKLSPI